MIAECLSWHRLGEQCRSCGSWTVPARFYWEEGKELPHERAERDYLAWAKDNLPGFRGADKAGQGAGGADKVRTRPVLVALADVPREDKHCRGCGRVFTGRGLVCWACQKRRQRGNG